MCPSLKPPYIDLVRLFPSLQVTALSEKLQEAEREAEWINSQEKLFSWSQTKYKQIKKMITGLDPYLTLWTNVSQFLNSFNTWMTGPFKNLDPEDVDAVSGDTFRKMFKLTKVFAGIGGSEPREIPAAVAEEAKHRVQAFQQYMPLVSAICNPGMRQRHWDVLATITGFEIKKDEFTTLKILLDNDIMDYLEKIVELSDRASREWSIEKALDKMQGCVRPANQPSFHVPQVPPCSCFLLLLLLLLLCAAFLP